MKLIPLVLAVAGLFMSTAQAATIQVNVNKNPVRCDGTDIATPEQVIKHFVYWDTQPMPGPAADAADCSAEVTGDPAGATVIDLEPNTGTVEFDVPDGATIYIRARASVNGVPSALTPEIQIDTPAAPVSSPQRPVIWVVGVDGDLTAVFGPVNQPTQYPSSAAIQGAQRLRITGTITQLGTQQGLISRDASGQAAAGHFSLWVVEDGRIHLRNQPGPGLPSVKLESLQPIVAGEPFGITVSLGPTNGLVLAVDGQDPVTSADYYPLHTNTLPVTIGGMCSTCVGDTGAPITKPISGTVRVQTFATEQ
jgi:hypothetical protein